MIYDFWLKIDLIKNKIKVTKTPRLTSQFFYFFNFLPMAWYAWIEYRARRMPRLWSELRFRHVGGSVFLWTHVSIAFAGLFYNVNPGGEERETKSDKRELFGQETVLPLLFLKKLLNRGKIASSMLV